MTTLHLPALHRPDRPHEQGDQTPHITTLDRIYEHLDEDLSDR